MKRDRNPAKTTAVEHNFQDGDKKNINFYKFSDQAVDPTA